MSLLVANSALQASTIGGSGQTSAAPEPASNPAGDPFRLPTDLGGLDHLFRDSFTSLSHTVSTSLHKATDSTVGPHGGLIPSSLQHAAAAAVSRVDGQQLEEVGQPVSTLYTRARTLVMDLRQRLGV